MEVKCVNITCLSFVWDITFTLFIQIAKLFILYFVVAFYLLVAFLKYVK